MASQANTHDQSQIRQNYHVHSENAINEKINEVLHRSYTYMSMAFFFDRDDVALSNIHKYFLKMSEHKRELAKTLINYQNSRGGRVQFQTIQGPFTDSWHNASDALKHSLQGEKVLNASFLNLYELAERSHDAHLGDFIEDQLLETQVKTIKELGDLTSQCKRAGPGLGEYMFNEGSFEH